MGIAGAGTPIPLLLSLDKVKISIAPISGLVWQSWQAGQGSEPPARRGQTSLLISCLGEVWERQEKRQHDGHSEDARCVLGMPKATITWAAAHQGTGQSCLCSSGTFLPGGTGASMWPASVTHRESTGQSPRGVHRAILGMPTALLGSQLTIKPRALFESKSHFQMPSFPTKERCGAVTSWSLGTAQRRIVCRDRGIPPCPGHAPACVLLISLPKLLLPFPSRWHVKDI